MCYINDIFIIITIIIIINYVFSYFIVWPLSRVGGMAFYQAALQFCLALTKSTVIPNDSIDLYVVHYSKKLCS